MSPSCLFVFPHPILLSGQDGLFNVIVFALCFRSGCFSCWAGSHNDLSMRHHLISTGINAFLINCTGYAIHPALSGRDCIVAYIPLAVGFPPPRVPFPPNLGCFHPLVESIGLVYNRFCRSALAPFQKRAFFVYW